MNGRLSQLLLSSHCLNIDVTRDNILVTTSRIGPNVPITVPYAFYYALVILKEIKVTNFLTLQGEEDVSSSEFDDDAVDQRSDIHREIKINQQRERELRYERNMLSDGSDDGSISDTESIASALSIRSKILKEIEEERMRDMEIQNEYRMRGLLLSNNKPTNPRPTESPTAFDEALKQQQPKEKCFVKVEGSRHAVSPAGAADIVLTGGEYTLLFFLSEIGIRVYPSNFLISSPRRSPTIFFILAIFGDFLRCIQRKFQKNFLSHTKGFLDFEREYPTAVYYTFKVL